MSGTKPLSGGNPGEPKACTPAEERGIAGATGAGQLPDGNAESTHDSANRRSPDSHTSSLSLDESNQQFIEGLLRQEATACAKHLDEMEGLGYSADVMRRCIAELNRLYREHDEDVDRMERAAEVVEKLSAECNQLRLDGGRIDKLATMALSQKVSITDTGVIPYRVCLNGQVLGNSLREVIDKAIMP